MFKQASVIDEVMESMEDIQADIYSRDEKLAEGKRSSAISLLKEAHDILSTTGYEQEAKKIAQEIIELNKNFSGNQSEQLNNNLNKLRENTQTVHEYVPAVLYLKSILDGRPNKDVYYKFGLNSPPDWVIAAASMPMKELQLAFMNHIESSNIHLDELNRTAQIFMSQKPRQKRKLINQQPITPQSALHDRMKRERDQMRRDYAEEYAPSDVKRIDPATGKEVEKIPLEFTGNKWKPKKSLKIEDRKKKIGKLYNKNK